jgi:hypothetical protein
MKKKESKLTRSWTILPLLLLLTSCIPKPTPEPTPKPTPETSYYKIISQKNNVLTFEIKGWTYVCESPKIYIPDGKLWIEVVSPPYNPRGYYLDDQYENLGMGCDVNVCGRGGTISINLDKYVSTGERLTPTGYFGSESYLVPSYRSEPIHGKIKIALKIYQVPSGDWDCANPMWVELTINN